MLDRLAWSEMFESFLASKYTAAKRFGLEARPPASPEQNGIVPIFLAYMQMLCTASALCLIIFGTAMLSACTRGIHLCLCQRMRADVLLHVRCAMVGLKWLV